MLFKNNKFYEDLIATEKEKENMISECFKILDNESLAPDDEISLRRNEKMKQKEYGEVIKKIAVASFSLIATGGIIAGVMNYNNSVNNQSGKSVVSNETTETVKKETTEKVTEETTEAMTDEFYEDEENSLEYAEDFDANSKEIVRYSWGNIKLDDKRILEVKEDGDIFKTRRYKIFLSEGGNRKEVDTVCCSKFYYSGCNTSFFSYGKNLYYFDNEGLKKLDTENLKVEYVFKGNDYSKIEGKGSESIFYFDDKKILFSTSSIKQTPGATDSEDWASVDYYMYEYDIKNNKLVFLGNKEFYDYIDDEYILTAELPGYKYDDNHPYEKRINVEKIENGKLKKVCCLGDRVLANFTYMGEDGWAYSEKNKNMFYYEEHEKELENGATDFSETTIMSYDIKTKKTEKVATISAEKLGIGKTKRLFVKELKDGYCKFIDGYVDEGSTYKYEYKTGKLEKMGSDESY